MRLAANGGVRLGRDPALGQGALRSVNNRPGKRGLVGRVQNDTVREKSALLEKMYGR
jgi:hypothetical protein